MTPRSGRQAGCEQLVHLVHLVRLVHLEHGIATPLPLALSWLLQRLARPDRAASAANLRRKGAAGAPTHTGGGLRCKVYEAAGPPV